MSLPVAIQVYSVREAASQNLYGTLKQLKKMGYEGVEFAGLYGHSAEEVREMCDDIGLVPISAHVPYNEMMGDPEGVLGTYAAIGCKYIALPYLSAFDFKHTPTKGTISEVAKDASMLGAVAKKLGMQLLYHNHDFEFTKIDGKYILDLLYEACAPEHLQTEVDVCWVHVVGEDPAKYLLNYIGRSPVVHLKDYVGDRSENMYELIGEDKTLDPNAEPFEFRPVGYGKQNFPEILKSAEKVGAEWVVVEMDKPTMGLTAMECAEKSRAYLKSIGN